MEILALIDKLENNRTLSDDEFIELLSGLHDADSEVEEYLYAKADAVRQQVYGKDVYIRGLIEISNYCKNDCYYCGIRRSNRGVERFRLSKEDILNCCRGGYDLGFRTFVMQGGEDAYFTDDRMCDIIRSIKAEFPDCAVTLSIGEKTAESYRKFYEAGADRYLLRHETADCEHYHMLHPAELSPEYRQQCLFELREIGYQIGCGIMVGAPGQTVEHVLTDLRFMERLQPHMVGIGPFIPHKDTPFRDEEAGTLRDTLHLLAILRLMFPAVLLPATTALGTIHPEGRELGIKAGANVIMPNLSPSDNRAKYALYEGKTGADAEAAESKADVERRMNSIGYHVVVCRGDYAGK